MRLKNSILNILIKSSKRYWRLYRSFIFRTYRWNVQKFNSRKL